MVSQRDIANPPGTSNTNHNSVRAAKTTGRNPPALSCRRRVLPDYAVASANLFVAPWGNDNNSATLSSPIRSLTEASRRARPGQLVMIRGGIYRALQRINRGGTRLRPVTYVAWPDETPIFDGSGIAMPKSVGIIQVSASHVVFDGVEIRNSAARGFSVYNASDVTLTRSHVHHTQHQGYAGSGTDLLVEQSTFHDLVLSQSGSVRTPDWSAGISTWYRRDGKPSRRFIFRDNSVQRVWGECIIALHATHSNIFNNSIRDCYSVGIYVDNSSNIDITRNLITTQSDEFNREGSGRRMTAVMIAVEYYSRRSATAKNITVANNLIIGTDRGVAFFADASTPSSNNTYGNVAIAHNVMCNIDHEAIDFQLADVVPPKRNLLVNNVLCGNINNGLRNVRIANQSSWVVRNNVFASQLDVNRLPGNLLTPPRFTLGSGYRFRNYRLRRDSPVRRRGVRLARVPLDAFCNQRNRNLTSIGLHEL